MPRFYIPCVNGKRIFPDFTNISTIGTKGACYLFYECKGLTSASFPSLTTINDSGCEDMFSRCTDLISVSFPILSQIDGSSAFSNTFNSCTSLTSVSFPELTAINGSSACSYMFIGCTSLTSISFPSLTTIRNYGCYYMFSSCTNIEHVYFNSLTTSSFGSYTNQFESMLNRTGNTKTHTIHFPSNLQSKISTLSGYPTFGGTSGYVTLSFDLPATS